MKRKKIAIVVGCRPDCIKMMPLLKELKRRNIFDVVLVSTGQHREMLDQVFQVFNEVPDYDLKIMIQNQSLFDITTNILNQINALFTKINPDIVLVHGDTSSAFAVALGCYYMRIPVGHVEAGLRTYDLYSPFPEEFNRQSISLISKYNFAPTEIARQNLLQEKKQPETIYLTGNTIIDAMRYTLKESYTNPELDWINGDKLIFLTAHRRENLGQPLRNIFKAVRRILDEHSECKVIYPIHMNPAIRAIAAEELVGCDQIHIIEPLNLIDCHNIESRAYLILTDSGGIQEEAAACNIPVLVLRDTTERIEGINMKKFKLVGTNEDIIHDEVNNLLANTAEYMQMRNSQNPYGDGHASEKIADIIEKYI